MRPRVAFAVLAAVLVGVPVPAVAGSLDHARIALHLTQVSLKNLCVPASQGGYAPDDRPCLGFATSGRVFGDYILYFLAAQADSGTGFGTLSLGIEYGSETGSHPPGISVSRWTSCAGGATPFDGPDGTWPASGSGIRLTWASCQTAPPLGYPEDGALAVAGFLEVSPYDPSSLTVVANPFDPLGPGLWVTDCAGEPTSLPPARGARVAFSWDGADPGYNPCEATSPPRCLIEPAAIDFGDRYVPSLVDTPLVVRNAGGDTLADAMVIVGAAYSGFGAFSIPVTNASFRIPPGGEITVPIRYRPQIRSSHGFVQFGTSCPQVELDGRGRMGVSASPSVLDFGVVPPETTKLDSFLVTNIAPVPLHVSLSLGGASALWIVQGGTLDLEAGESRFVVAAFRPLLPVRYSAGVTVEGNGLCTLTGTAEQICLAFPDSVVFPPRELDAVADTTVTLENRGGITVTGSIPANGSYGDGAFRILSGAGDYALAPGQSRSLALRFAPRKEGRVKTQVSMGTPCGSLYVEGTGTTRCDVVPETVHFGIVAVGGEEESVFHLYNRGQDPLLGEVPAADKAEFSIVSGQGPFALSPGAVHSVTVRFHPFREGTETMNLDLGLLCGPIVIDGYGYGTESPGPEPVLALHVRPHNVTSLCHPPVSPGANPHPLPCSQFAVAKFSGPDREFDVYVVVARAPVVGVSGAGFGIAYNEVPGAGVDVTDWRSCTDLEFPTDDWPASGSGDVLTWDHSFNCHAATIEGYEDEGVQAVLGAFTVSATGTDLFRITPRYFAGQPGPEIVPCDLVSRVIPASDRGYAAFSPERDIPGCNPCLGPCVEPGLWCAAIPGQVAFDSVLVEGVADTVLRVINISPREVAGEVALDPGPFRVLDGDGPFRLAAGEERRVRVRFSPSEAGTYHAALRIGATSPDVPLSGRGWIEPAPEEEEQTETGPLTASIVNDASRGVEIRLGGRVIQQTGRAEIRIFDVRGRLVHAAELNAGDAGTYLWRRDDATGRGVPVGVYYLRVRSGTETVARSFVLLR